MSITVKVAVLSVAMEVALPLPAVKCQPLADLRELLSAVVAM